uniref:hypothetical protein n=1 Tax=Salmonella sp. s55004 TaxID=3159675 RepID=UPI00397EA0DD
MKVFSIILITTLLIVCQNGLVTSTIPSEEEQSNTGDDSNGWGQTGNGDESSISSSKSSDASSAESNEASSGTSN